MAAVARIQTVEEKAINHGYRVKCKWHPWQCMGLPFCTHFKKGCHGIAMEICLPIYQLIAFQTSVDHSKRRNH